MAKCSCAGSSCGCRIIPGPGVFVEGTGNASAPYRISFAAQQSDATVDIAGPLDLSDVGGYSTVSVTLNANATSVSLPESGARVDIILIQGVANRTVSWPAGIRWPGGDEPVLSTGVGDRDWVTLLNAGGVWHGVLIGAGMA